jgi:hypothetical protein
MITLVTDLLSDRVQYSTGTDRRHGQFEVSVGPSGVVWATSSVAPE